MATGKGKVPNRTKKSGGGASAKKAEPVGYGQHGHPFYNIEKYHQSKSGRAHAAAAKAGHPLSTKPVGYGENHKAFFNPAKYANSKVGRSLAASANGTPGGTVHQQPHAPMPGHPSQNPTHVHGPASTGTIKGGAIRAPRMK
jgi:hypothetical protein